MKTTPLLRARAALAAAGVSSTLLSCEKNLTGQARLSPDDKIGDPGREGVGATAPFSFPGEVPIPLEAYLNRIARYIPSSTSTFAHSLVLMDRVIAACPEFNVFLEHAHRAHKFFCLAFHIAGKSIEDRWFTNKYIAEVGGMVLEDFNECELRFLSLLGCDTQPKATDSFDAYMHQIWDHGSAVFLHQGRPLPEGDFRAGWTGLPRQELPEVSPLYMPQLQ